MLNREVEKKIRDHDAQLEQKASKEYVDIQSNRISNIIANNNPTEGNTELIDIRLGADGTRYSSAGDSLRSQMKEVLDARTNSFGTTFNKIGDNIKNIDNLLKENILRFTTLVNYSADEILNNQDSNNCIYINFLIKKGDIYEVSTKCNQNHTITLVKSIPKDNSLANVEVVNEIIDIKERRFIADSDYSGFLIWHNNKLSMTELIIKKISFNEDLLNNSKNGYLYDAFRRNIIYDGYITEFISNISHKEFNFKRGKYYKISISEKFKYSYSFVLSNATTKTPMDKILISDTTEPTADFIFHADDNYRYARFWISNTGNNFLRVKIEELSIKITNNHPYEKIYYIASSNSSEFDKERADFICSGVNDEKVINRAIALLKYGGTIQLFDGDYYIDAFENTNSAIFIDNSGFARTITIRGTTENKSFLSHYGVVIHVTEKAFSTLNDVTQYSVFNSVDYEMPIGDWKGLINNANFENFYIYLHNSSKKIIGINGYNLGSEYVEQVGVYTKSYFSDRFGHKKPATPVVGCIGFTSPRRPNDEMAKIGFNCANAGGLHTGFSFFGVEHLIINTCTSSRNCYGYEFKGPCDKTITMINCADEGNTHLPRFIGNGHLTAIDFCIERLDSRYIPDDPNGDTEIYATEDTESGWKGSFSYMIQGSANNINGFWKNGQGKGFRTVNLAHQRYGTIPPSRPEFLEEYFRIDINKKVIWNGLNWIDLMGNIVD